MKDMNAKLKFRWILFSLFSTLSLIFSLFSPGQVASVKAANGNVCGTPGQDGSLTISTTATVNTYYPGLGNASGTTIAVGAASGAMDAIQPGNLLLVIQMQGADIFINPANPGDANYGSNAGSGSGNLNDANFVAGNYELVVAANTVPAAGGTILLASGLTNNYASQDYPVGAGGQGQRRFQVVRVPQYLDLTITATGSVVPYPWNGDVGGVVAMDVADTLNLADNAANGNINANGRGFRGGGGLVGVGRAGTLNTDYWTVSPTPNGSKGEGTAGTPRYIFNGVAVVDNGAAAEGYPGGTMGRGAPGNAGGGGTDGRPANNDYNTGGGGGGNGGSGGRGGFSWNSVVNSGGVGGAAFPASATRLVLGGGGGAGAINNNDPVVSSGGAGAGLVFVRAGVLTGSGTVLANGADGQDQPLNDSGGGAGAGGSVILRAVNWNPASLDIQAHGGQGGDAWSVSSPGTADPLATGAGNHRHGPGGGGGGGAIYVSSLANVTTDVTGGLNGSTTTDGSSYGALPGNPGVVGAAPLEVVCAADLRITKTDGRPTYTPGGSITYTVVVTNDGPDDVIGATVADPLPGTIAGVTWSCVPDPGASCTAAGVGNVNDTVNLPVGLNLTYTITGTVSASMTGDLVNTATVAVPIGYVDPTPENNTATDTDVNTALITDLAITKDDGSPTYTPGGSITYAIVVTNNGPSAVTGATVTDNVPAAITGVTWTCVPGLGASCSPSGSGNINDTVNIPVGINLTYTLKGTVSPATTGLLTNTVTVNVPAGTTDSNPNNNSASDTDIAIETGVPVLEITKDDGQTIVAPGSLLTYSIVVTNTGTVPATGVTILDTLPAGVTFVSANRGGVYTPGTHSVAWPVFTLRVGVANAQTFRLSVRVKGSVTSGSISNTVSVHDDGSSTGGDPVGDEDTDTDQVVVSQVKLLVGSNDNGSKDPQMLVGEILTYQISLDIPAGDMQALTALDILDYGLAFVRCVSIDPGLLTTNLPGGFAAACDDPLNPKVSSQPVGNPNQEHAGRRLEFTFGDVANSSASEQTLRVNYEVVVLDIKSNKNGLNTLNNKITWAWKGGQISGSAVPIAIIEPALAITKTADSKEAKPKTKVRFTLAVSHAAGSAAPTYDVLVTDKVPAGFDYVPGSLKIVSGPPDGVASDTAAPNLKITWPVFKRGQKAEIIFDAIYQGPGKITNVSAVVWTSLLIDPKTPQSVYNRFSTERIYGPVKSSASVDEKNDDDPPDDDDDDFTGTPVLLPVTGFAPERVTALPRQSIEQRYVAMNGMWLEIPALNLALPLTGVPLASTGWDLTWLSNQAGYLEGTTYPGQVGTTGLTGHVYLADGTPGPFVNLHKLSWGQQVILHANGYRYLYEVRSNRVVSPSDMSVLKQDGYTWLTLLTCKDYNPVRDSYAHRLAVRAVLISVESEQ